MADMQSQDSIDQIAEEMVKEIEEAEEKDKAIDENSIETSNPYSEEETEEERIKRKGSSQKRKIFHLQQEKDKISQEAIFLAQENLALRNQYELALSKAQTSGDAAMAHYQNSINLEVSRLKEDLKKAHEMNDVDTIADINLSMGKLGAKADAMEAYNLQQYQQQLQQQQHQQELYQNPYPYYNNPQYSQEQSQPQEQPIELKEETKEWINRNPWLLQNHDDYDPEKIQEVLTYSKMLDLNLKRNGREDQIHSNDYYNALDQYAQSAFGDEIAPQRSAPPPVHRNLEQSFSNNSRVPVAPVRKSASGNYNNSSSRNIKLTDIDKDMMKQFERYGVTPESYAKAKIKTNEDYRKAVESGDLGSLQSWGLI